MRLTATEKKKKKKKTGKPGKQVDLFYWYLYACYFHSKYIAMLTFLDTVPAVKACILIFVNDPGSVRLTHDRFLMGEVVIPISPRPFG